MIDAKVLSRGFSYNGVKLPDPDSRMTPEEVEELVQQPYPELASAAITGPEASGDHLQYSFVRYAQSGPRDETLTRQPTKERNTQSGREPSLCPRIV
jgi:PRTRC genetic system protein C